MMTRATARLNIDRLEERQDVAPGRIEERFQASVLLPCEPSVSSQSPHSGVNIMGETRIVTSASSNDLKGGYVTTDTRRCPGLKRYFQATSPLVWCLP